MLLSQNGALDGFLASKCTKKRFRTRSGSLRSLPGPLVGWGGDIPFPYPCPSTPSAPRFWRIIFNLLPPPNRITPIEPSRLEWANSPSSPFLPPSWFRLRHYLGAMLLVLRWSLSLISGRDRHTIPDSRQIAALHKSFAYSLLTY